MTNLLVLCAAAFAGGALNAVAGGGSFLTLPALTWAGVPLVMANATGTAALLPGYLTSAWAQRRDLNTMPGLSAAHIAGLASAGGACGALLLAFTPDTVFARVVPWLLLCATLLFLAGPRLLARTRRLAPHTPPDTATLAGWPARLALFAVCLYGGYFNGGLGILLLALFSLQGHTNLHAMNGAKNLASSVLTLIAVTVYGLHGAVDWRLALPMMAAAALGGWAGARAARHVPALWLRTLVVVTGALMTVLFFLRA